jgi:hypothetical protein
MKPFVFKQFEILQDKEVFRVGTDGVVLGALCNGESYSCFRSRLWNRIHFSYAGAAISIS